MLNWYRPIKDLRDAFTILTENEEEILALVHEHGNYSVDDFVKWLKRQSASFKGCEAEFKRISGLIFPSGVPKIFAAICYEMTKEERRIFAGDIPKKTSKFPYEKIFKEQKKITKDLYSILKKFNSFAKPSDWNSDVFLMPEISGKMTLKQAKKLEAIDYDKIMVEARRLEKFSEIRLQVFSKIKNLKSESNFAGTSAEYYKGFFKLFKSILETLGLEISDNRILDLFALVLYISYAPSQEMADSSILKKRLEKQILKKYRK